MTRQEAEAMVAGGFGRWDGSVLVLPPRPLPQGGVLTMPERAEPSRVSWPGWMRTRDGEWIQVPV